MRRTAAAVALTLALLLVSSSATAADPRIQVVSYAPDQVLPLPVAAGYAAVVELGPDERVDSVVVGNSAAWSVTASKRGDRVVVKPIGDGAATNMVISTDQRRYVFLLQPASAQEAAPFVVRFTYPAPAGEITATRAVATFKYSGARELFPIAMSDDGMRTTVTWGKDTELPAIFSVDKGREAIVNGRMVAGEFVIESVAPRFLFKLGKAQATATRRPIKAAR